MKDEKKTKEKNLKIIQDEQMKQ